MVNRLSTVREQRVHPRSGWVHHITFLLYWRVPWSNPGWVHVKVARLHLLLVVVICEAVKVVTTAAIAVVGG